MKIDNGTRVYVLVNSANGCGDLPGGLAPIAIPLILVEGTTKAAEEYPCGVANLDLYPYSSTDEDVNPDTEIGDGVMAPCVGLSEAVALNFGETRLTDP